MPIPVGASTRRCSPWAAVRARGRGHLPLSRAPRGERKGERPGLGGFRFGEGSGFEELVEEETHAARQVLQNRLGLVHDRKDLRGARLDVCEYEAARDVALLGRCHRVHVPAKLELEALQARRARELREVLGEVERLDLVHDDAALFVEAPVQPPFEDAREIVHRERQPDAALRRVAGNRREVLSEHPAVHSLADPEPLEPFPAVESDAPRGPGEESAGRNGDRLFREIDLDRHGRL